MRLKPKCECPRLADAERFAFVDKELIGRGATDAEALKCGIGSQRFDFFNQHENESNAKHETRYKCQRQIHFCLKHQRVVFCNDITPNQNIFTLTHAPLKYAATTHMFRQRHQNSQHHAWRQATTMLIAKAVTMAMVLVLVLALMMVMGFEAKAKAGCDGRYRYHSRPIRDRTRTTMDR
jgi:hypothetical protein